jgi:SAM-dependent methyltransferase
MTSAAQARREAGPDYLDRNTAAWNRWAPYYAAAGRRAWQEPEPRWGMWGVLESDLGLLEYCEPGMNAVDLGCGTGAVCAWLARAGLNPVGVDISSAQLENARLFQREFDLSFRLEPANAESLPYEDASFDFAISEYGASLWCDPHRWIPEAARLLRPGGRLVFLVNGTILMLCMNEGSGVAATDRMLRPYFGMHRLEWPDDPGVEFHLGHGDWIRLLRRSGFEIEDLIEVRPPEGATTRYPFVTLEWSRRWPCEEIWIARRRG